VDWKGGDNDGVMEFSFLNLSWGEKGFSLAVETSLKNLTKYPAIFKNHRATAPAT